MACPQIVDKRAIHDFFYGFIILFILMINVFEKLYLIVTNQEALADNFHKHSKRISLNKPLKLAKICLKCLHTSSLFSIFN